MVSAAHEKAPSPGGGREQGSEEVLAHREGVSSSYAGQPRALSIRANVAGDPERIAAANGITLGLEPLVLHEGL
jgi:hypothetical protein